MGQRECTVFNGRNQHETLRGTRGAHTPINYHFSSNPPVEADTASTMELGAEEFLNGYGFYCLYLSFGQWDVVTVGLFLGSDGSL